MTQHFQLYMEVRPSSMNYPHLPGLNHALLLQDCWRWAGQMRLYCALCHGLHCQHQWLLEESNRERYTPLAPAGRPSGLPWMKMWVTSPPAP